MLNRRQWQLGRGTAAEWTLANPILLDGEFGFEKDTGGLKIGNGSDVWSDLDYINGGGGFFSGSIEDFIDLADVPNSYSGQANRLVSVKNDETGLEFVDPGSISAPPVGPLTLMSAENAHSVTIPAVVLGAASSLVGWYYCVQDLTNYNPIWGNNSSNEMYFGDGGAAGKLAILKSNSIIFRSTSNLAKDGWHLLIITDDGAQIKAYFDNADIGNSIGYTTLSGFSITRFCQGQNSNNFKGYFNQLAIFNRALDSTERSIIWNGGDGVYADIANAPFNSGLTAGWTLDDGKGLLVPDISGNANTGVLTSLGQWSPYPNFIIP